MNKVWLLAFVAINGCECGSSMSLDGGAGAGGIGGSTGAGGSLGAGGSAATGGSGGIDAGPTLYVINGTVSGLSGSGLVLRVNGAEQTIAPTATTFRAATGLPSGASFAVLVETQPSAPTQTCVVEPANGVITSADVMVSVTCTTNTYQLCATVTGLAGTTGDAGLLDAGEGSLVLLNGADRVTASADGQICFTTRVASGSSFSVLATNPSNPVQQCTVTGGSGTVVAGNVSTVAVNCSLTSWTVGGSVSGLVGTGAIATLRDTSGTALQTTPLAMNGLFAFATPLSSGQRYQVALTGQPTAPSQTCVVSNGSGQIAGANVTSVSVVCTTNTYPLCTTVSGLTAVDGGLSLDGGVSPSALVLRNALADAGVEQLVVTANGQTCFQENIASGAAFSVTAVAPTLPPQTCVVMGGSGTVIAGPVSSVAVNCSLSRFTIGGTVTGLVGSGATVELRDAMGTTQQQVALSMNGSFAFPQTVETGRSFSVVVPTQPSMPSQTCTVTNGTGNVQATAISNVSITCTTNTYEVCATISGLQASTGDAGIGPIGSGVLVLTNGAGAAPDRVSVNSNAQVCFPVRVPSGGAFDVRAINPTNPSQSCRVTGGTGTVVASRVDTVGVNCALDRFTVGGIVTGLRGAAGQLSLRDQSGTELQTVNLSMNGSYAFPTTLPSGQSYQVAVTGQPTGPWQTCVVSASSGLVAGANITTANVDCTTNTYAVGGSVSGLPNGETVSLSLNGGAATSVSNGQITFVPLLSSGDMYTVTASGATGRNRCFVSNGTGVITNAPVTSVAVTCLPPVVDVTFNFTGAAQTFTVPPGITSIEADLFGAQGNSNGSNVVGGLGGRAQGTLAVQPGDVLSIWVGGGAQPSLDGGFNGGGAAQAHPCATAAAGGGGGASDIRINGVAASNRVIVAAGGGGAGGNRVAGCGRGGGGGGGGGWFGGGGGAAWPFSSTVLPTGGTQTDPGLAGTSAWTLVPNNNGANAVGEVGGAGGAEVGSNQAGSQTGAVGGNGGGLVGEFGAYLLNFSGQSGAGGSSFVGTLPGAATMAGTRTGPGIISLRY